MHSDIAEINVCKCVVHIAIHVTFFLKDDSEILRLISEIDGCISLLPAVVGSTNVQAEIALALQPLRSENAQLRRSVAKFKTVCDVAN